VKELVVISGKGGTGKTSIVASFAALARNAVFADCDVDAADLHLVVAPHVRHRQEFVGSKLARIEPERCTACGKCAEVCQFDAVAASKPPHGSAERTTYQVDPISCEGCSVCAHFCPTDAIRFEDAVSGEWFISDTRHGPMVHAKLGVAAENSGKLVTLVRTQARRIAEENARDLVIADGAPGIGCPVIASIAGATLVLVVAEPTLSGRHDLERVCELTRHFGAKTAVCINKCDLNPELAATIEAEVKAKDVPVLGKVSYDPAVTETQVRGLSVVEADHGRAAEEIRALWDRVRGGL
jgi:MinD superfamily P-loop ATPase